MERIGDVLKEMRHAGRLNKGITVQSLGDVWPAVQSLWGENTVGRYVAANSHPSQFRNGNLTIICANPSIMQVLSEQKGSIIKKRNAHMGAQLIHNLSFGLENVHEVVLSHHLAASPAEEPVVERLDKTIRLSPEQVAQAERTAQGIQNSTLRAAFIRAYEAWMRWEVWRRREQQRRRQRRAEQGKY